MLERIIALALILIILSCSKPSESEPVLNNEDDPEEAYTSPPILSYSHFHSENSSLTRENIVKLWVYQNRYLILLTKEGDNLFCLVKMEIETEHFEQIYCQESITDIEVDDEGPIYVATQFDGLLKIDGLGNILAHYKTENSCLNSNYISAVAIDENGMIYLGELHPRNLDLETAHYVGSGLIRLDPSSSECEIWHTDNSPLPANAILDIEVNSRGIWVSTKQIRLVYTTYQESFGSSGGLVHIENNQWKTFSKEEYPQLISHLIFDLKTVVGEELWFENSFYSGLPRSSRRSIIIRVDEDGALEEIGEQAMSSQTGLKDTFGRYVFGGRKSIPISYYQTESEATLVVVDGGLKYDFTMEIKDTMSISAMAIDMLNTIWIGGTKGLFSVGIE